MFFFFPVDISFLIVIEKSLTPEEQKQENFGRKCFPVAQRPGSLKIGMEFGRMR